tara:strand:+ start:1083 stop:2447 length:1365 start_codon:yes stop_codon:yes gene_type:complete
MKMIKTICAIGVVAASLNASNVMAKVSAEEAAKLGASLTPVGAEKAGNADGSIPEWTGGITAPPAGYAVGNDYIDPFSDDKALFKINKANMDQYKGKLSEGQMRMLSKYDSYFMNVYPTRRSVSYPKEIVDFAKKNAVTAEMIDGGNGIKGIEGVIPFPITTHPIEMIWNHIMRNRGGSFERQSVQVTPTESGDFAPVQFYEEFSTRFDLTDYATNTDDNVYFYFKQMVTAPARLAGNVLLAHETIDQVREPRRAWIYNAGQRRVRRAPQVAYDGPGTASDGLRTTDQFDAYNGATDRYNWKFEGKQELYVPYNSYALDDRKFRYKDLVKPGNLNQNPMRYELHRVWKVTGTLKEGQRHIYSKRTFYIDEDSWAILAADHFDGRGELWRNYEAHNKFFYDVNSPFTTVEITHDLLSGRYIALGLANELPYRYKFTTNFSSSDFTPAALRRSGQR